MTRSRRASASRGVATTLEHRGERGDPLYGIRDILRAGRENLTERQKQRLADVFAVREEHVEVDVAWQCAQRLRGLTNYDNHRPRMLLVAGGLDPTTPT